MWSVTRERTGGLNFLVRGYHAEEGGRELSPQTPPLLVDTDPPIRKLLKRVLGLLTVLFLKRVSETIYFKATNLQHRLKEVKER